MLEQFKIFIQKHRLFTELDRILLAVSGGIDSMVMANLFYRAGYNFAIAHCNFGLRSHESDEDQELVEKIAKTYQAEIHTIRFDTADYAKQKGISIQMAARELRYNWFFSLCDTENFNYIAAAQHQNDSIETFHINLLRGTGLSGLTGIKPKKRRIIRPLLFTNRSQIVEYSQLYNIAYREDSSNISTKYIRNKLRHEVLPILADTNPAYQQNMMQTISNLRNVEIIYNQLITEKKNSCLEKKGDQVLIEIDKIRFLSPLPLYLYEFIKEFGFNYNHAVDISRIINSVSGRQFYSATHRLVNDRDYLLIDLICTENKSIIELSKDFEGKIELPDNKCIQICSFDRTKDFNFMPYQHIAHLDYNKIDDSMRLRKWENGDSFFPLGMKHRKKLSDFFIDNKTSIVEKQKKWMLVSGENIAWVVGDRIDNRFKITDKTTKILELILTDVEK